MGVWHLSSRGMAVLPPHPGLLALLMLIAAMVWPETGGASANVRRAMAGTTASDASTTRIACTSICSGRSFHRNCRAVRSPALISS